MSQEGMRERVGARGAARLVASVLGLAACGEAPDTGMFPEGDGITEDADAVEDPTDLAMSDVDAATNPDAQDATASDMAAPDTLVADAELDVTTECPAPCQNGGTCDEGACDCASGWSGVVCDEPVCGLRCADHGRCIAPDVCQCDPGWFGIECTVEGQKSVIIGASNGSIGSPLSEYGRVRDREAQRNVRITRAFRIHDSEMTRAEWAALAHRMVGQRILPDGMEGQGEDLPVTNITWWSAVSAANALSERDGLTPCYMMSFEELKQCSVAGGTGQFRTAAEMWQAVFSGRLQCPSELPSRFQNDAGGPADMLDCDGWRLPTEAEWEIAARSAGGSSPLLGSAMYDVAGNPSNPAAAPSGSCDAALAVLLDGVTWWCGNSAGAPGPVRGRAPTAAGLHEMLGNVAEWVWDGYEDAPAGGTDARVDAITPTCSYSGLSDLNCRVRRGGTFAHSTESGAIPWRFAFRAPFGAGRQSAAVGVRWVRGGKD